MVNTYFLDSSALVKRYVPETGSAWVKAIANPQIGNTLIIARITWVEVLSALSRRQREGSLTVTDINQIVQTFRSDLNTQYRVIEVDPVLVEKAGQLVVQYPLRAYDSIQLASALNAQSSYAQIPNTQFIFVTADVRLINIAQSENVIADNPNNYP